MFRITNVAEIEDFITADAKPHPEPGHRINFLTLPPEVRNHIYSFCNDSPIKYMPTAVPWGRLFPTTEIRFFNLTKVCRQIRREFYPIYMNTIERWVPVRSVEPYLETFHWNNRFESGVKFHPANIVIDYGVGTTTMEPKWQLHVSDLIALRKSSKGTFRFRLACTGGDETDQMRIHSYNVLFGATGPDPTWVKWLEDAPSVIQLDTKRARTEEIYFRVKQEYARPWMTASSDFLLSMPLRQGFEAIKGENFQNWAKEVSYPVHASLTRYLEVDVV